MTAIRPAEGQSVRCCYRVCTREHLPCEGLSSELGPVMLIKAVRVLVGWSGAGPRPHLIKSHLSDTF